MFYLQWAPKKMENICRIPDAAFSSFLGFGVRGLSESNFLASTVVRFPGFNSILAL